MNPSENILLLSISSILMLFAAHINDPPTYDGYTSDQIMIAMTVYMEARGEPEEGQIQVARVIRNRVASPRYPNTVQSVILQPNQFESWADHNRAKLRAIPETDPNTFMKILRLTAPVTADGGFLNFHAHTATPAWASYGTGKTTIGNHIFYLEALKS